MTIGQLNTEIDDLINEWDNGFVPLYIAVSTVKGEMGIRIFDDGKNAADKQLPSPAYSSKPLYADVNSLPSTPTQYQVGKRGKKIKSAYFPNGYGQLKQAINRKVLELTNRLDIAFSNSTPIETGAYSVQITVPDEEAGKVEGLENKYGAIFSLTKEEDKLFTDTLDFEIQKAFNNLFR